MISQRQIDFRQEYRSRIIGWYDGYFHIVIIYAMGAAAFYIYVEHIHNVTWLEWLTVPLTFLFTNLFEWAVHKYVMHRPVNIKGLRAIYERHTLNHHQFFTDEEMRFRDHKDWRVTVFPPYALVVFILMSIPMAVILGLLFSPNVGWLFMCVTTGMYLVYEFMHFCCHVEENWFVRNCPVRQHAAPPSHRASQRAADDGDQHEPDVPDCGLAVRHVGPRPRARRHAAQRLRYPLPEEESARPSAPAGRGGGGAGGRTLVRFRSTRLGTHSFSGVTRGLDHASRIYHDLRDGSAVHSASQERFAKKMGYCRVKHRQ